LQKVGQSKPNRPAICYSGDLTEVGPKVLQMANEVCAKQGLHARYTGSIRWQCRLNTPHRAYFTCE
jgi:hypothetical protein